MANTDDGIVEVTLVEEILDFTKISQQDESYPVVKQGVEAFYKMYLLENLLKVFVLISH
ncbi:hypothetical protein [Psychrosphaera sp. G1-22]|uniref:Uncharacterized protein n=1 Tax=Psychrosphaera algicola TaxID=3023714 RepID=A0ABT5FGU9_9GAMM|nr:hypothetical protein [Psychrosphaera sp. G1-22]MDC2890165.1 hypothetical protein [Psychrosphaera sp. G1-22]